MRADQMQAPDDDFGRRKRRLHPRNERRAALAAAAVKAFRGREYKNETDETVIGDLIANLFHLCNRERIDLEILIERGRSNYRAELGRGDVDEQNARRLEREQ